MALDVQNKQPPDHANGEGASGDADGLVSRLSQAGSRRTIPVTLDLFRTNLTTSHIQLEESSPLPSSWQAQFLNLKTGEIYCRKKNSVKKYLEETTMSRRNGGGSSSPKLDLKLNLSPPRGNRRIESPSRSATVSPTSPPSSCVSSELNQEEALLNSNSPEATSMVLVGCPRCLMYVMLSEDEPKCPKCKSTVLLDFPHENATTTTATPVKKTWKN